MALKAARVAFPYQGRALSVCLDLNIFGFINDFLPMFQIPFLFVYLGMDVGPKTISEVSNQEVFIRGRDNIELF